MSDTAPDAWMKFSYSWMFEHFENEHDLYWFAHHDGISMPVSSLVILDIYSLIVAHFQSFCIDGGDDMKDIASNVA